MKWYIREGRVLAVEMASVPQDDDEFTAERTEAAGMTDDWVVRVDIFDVNLSFTVKNGNACLVESSCNCDAPKGSDCRHTGIAEGRVRAVFNDEPLAGVGGVITHAPALWRPIVDGDTESSDTPL